MQIEKLRSLIREAVDNQLKEIEAVAEAAAMEARLAEYDKAIKTCESKIQAAENLEEVKELVDENKLNELKKKLKSLTKAKEKLEKAKAKKNKGKEVTTDAETDKEETVDEGPYSQNNNMGDDIENANVDETYTMDEMENDSMKEEALNESFLKMQKLAGVITEGQYRKKVQMLNEKMSYDDFESMVKPFLDLAKTKGWVWNGAGDSWFDIPSPAVALYHSTELPTTADGEFKGQKMIASKDPVISNQVQSYRGAIEQKQGDVIMQPDYNMNQVYFQSKDKAILDAIKASMANATEVVQDAKELSSQLTSAKSFEPVKYYSMLLRKKA
jgi:hypothetical protein